MEETIIPCLRMEATKNSTSLCKSATLPRHNAHPVRLSLKEEVTLNGFPNIIAWTSFRFMVATHFPPANPSCPPIILANS